MDEFTASLEYVSASSKPVMMQMGRDILVAVKARMKITGSEGGMIEAINHVEVEFKKQFPKTLWLFFKPDHG